MNMLQNNEKVSLAQKSSALPKFLSNRRNYSGWQLNWIANLGIGGKNNDTTSGRT